jgi:hypothetical protein
MYGRFIRLLDQVSLQQEEEVKMATVVYLVVAVVGSMFVAFSLISLQTEERKD